MKHLIGIAVLIMVVWSPAAQGVPATINYQGTVEVNGTLFTGAGLFRFAIVDTPAAPWNTVYWSNDGADPPQSDLSITVSDGVFSIVLGMSPQLPLSDAVFSGDQRYLAIWFDDGVNGVQLLEPFNELTSVGYAFQAENAASAETVTGLESGQFLRSDQADTMNGNLTLNGNLEASGPIRATEIISPVIKASPDNSVATVDFDTLPNNAQNSGVTIGKIRAMAGQNNGQPYLWIRGNGAQSWILDHTGPGVDWAQSMGAYYNDVKQGNIGFFGHGPTVDYLSIGFGHPDWWNTYSRVVIWNSGRIQFMPPATTGLSLDEPSAWLVLAPGSIDAASAPLKFRTGSLMTTPETGAVEFDGVRLFVTDESAQRNTVAYLDDIPLQPGKKQGITEKIPVITDVQLDPETGTLLKTIGTLVIEDGVIIGIE